MWLWVVTHLEPDQSTICREPPSTRWFEDGRSPAADPPPLPLRGNTPQRGKFPKKSVDATDVQQTSEKSLAGYGIFSYVCVLSFFELCLFSEESNSRCFASEAS